MAANSLTPQEKVHEHFVRAQTVESDIKGHIVRIYGLVTGMDQRMGPLRILELGTRGGNSTSAFLAAVQTQGRGHVYSVDIVASCGELFKGHSQWTFIHADSRDVTSVIYGMDGLLSAIVAIATNEPPKFHILFVDTEHDYAQVMSELTIWYPWMLPGGFILVHDSETGPNCKRAVFDFIRMYGLEYTHEPSYNGLTTIYVPQASKQADGGSSDDEHGDC